MPCFTIRQNTVRLDVAEKNPELLKRALESEGYSSIQLGTHPTRLTAYHPATRQTITISGGQLRLRSGTEQIAGALTCAYAREAVKEASRRVGWRVVEESPVRLKVTRRA